MMNQIQGVKVYLVALLFLLGCAILFYFITQQSNEIISNQSNNRSITARSNDSGTELPNESSDKSVKSRKIIQNNTSELMNGKSEYKDKVAEKKSELEVLMKKFNENISNPAVRDEIRSQIKRTMASYNELILPEAIQQTQNNDQQVEN